jgi:hypothetical protein
MREAGLVGAAAAEQQRSRPAGAALEGRRARATRKPGAVDRAGAPAEAWGMPGPEQGSVPRAGLSPVSVGSSGSLSSSGARDGRDSSLEWRAGDDVLLRSPLAAEGLAWGARPGTRLAGDAPALRSPVDYLASGEGEGSGSQADGAGALRPSWPQGLEAVGAARGWGSAGPGARGSGWLVDAAAQASGEAAGTADSPSDSPLRWRRPRSCSPSDSLQEPQLRPGRAALREGEACDDGMWDVTNTAGGFGVRAVVAECERLPLSQDSGSLGAFDD